jgi:hypothetical protein
MAADIAIMALPIKMVLVAAIVVVASLAAQKAGPFVGGLIATLPLSAGPGYVVLAMDHGAGFIAESTVASVAINAATVAFVLVYAVLARGGAGGLGSIAGAVGLWLASAYAIQAETPPLWLGLALNAVVFAAAVPLSRRFADVRPPAAAGARRGGLAMRALSVAALVGLLSAVSWQIGPRASGVLALFPIVISSLLVVVHRAAGGPAAAAVAANSVYGLAGFVGAVAIVHVTAVPLGAPAALMIGLVICLVWNGFLFALRVVRLRRAAATAA